ncbi:MAG TPA: hypothetical protein VFG06_08850, partial [Thermodesulfovibrionales bacterium]|nr:hypothetical protein [Thermodesulfovibrionales bacterium]
MYKSEDGGNSWARIDIPLYHDDYWEAELSDSYLNKGVIAFSTSYSQDSTIFLGFRYLYRSKDKGKTWEHLDKFHAPSITDIV